MDSWMNGYNKRDGWIENNRWMVGWLVKKNMGGSMDRNISK